MARTNNEVEQALMEYADLLSILTDDPYKPRAYEKAARAVGGYHADLRGMDLDGILAIPSVGKSIGEKIQIARARERNPLGNGEEHDQDEYSNDFKGVPPTNALNQAVNQKGRNCTAYA